MYDGTKSKVQTVLPVSASRQTTPSIGPFFAMVKRRLPTMVAEEKALPSGTFHSTLGGFAFQSQLSPFSVTTPSRLGPRNWGQSLATAEDANASTRRTSNRFVVIVCLFSREPPASVGSALAGGSRLNG